MKYKIAIDTWIEIWRCINAESECVASIIVSKGEDHIQTYDCFATIKDGISTGIALIGDVNNFIITKSVEVLTEDGLKNIPTDEKDIPQYLSDIGILPNFIQ